MGKKIQADFRNAVSFLCGKLRRKKNSAQNPDAEPGTRKDDSDSGASPPSEGDESSPPPEQREAENAAQTPYTDEDELQNRPLPPPPGMQHIRAASCHHQPTQSNMSRIRRVSSSLSMGILSSASRREDSEKKKKKKNLKQEDSVWKKTIILGEKCRVPDGDDDTVLYDEKGKRIPTFHPKNTGQMASFSRQNSGIDQDSVPGILRLRSQSQRMS